MMTKVAIKALVVGIFLCAGIVGCAETGSVTEIQQLKTTITEQGKQLEELRQEISLLKNAHEAAATQTAMIASFKPAVRRSTVNPGTLEQRNKALNEAMESFIEGLQLDPIYLRDLPATLKTHYGLDVKIDYKALASNDIDGSLPLSVNVGRAKLGAALQTLLASCEDKKMDFDVIDGFVVISTQEAIVQNTSVQMYDIRNLITQMSKRHPSLEIRDHITIVKEIVDGIEETIKPDSWRETGGTLGSIREMYGILFIRHNKRAHAEIAEFLNKLQETYSKP